MKRLTVIIVGLLAYLLQPGPAGVVAGSDAASRLSFAFVDVFIDPRGVPLAAYQLELRTPSGDVKLVGIEGGDHAAFALPPYYDPKALLNDRVVIAAFNTAPAKDLPAAKTRVARLMIRSAGTKPSFEVTLHVAASANAKPLKDAVISISEGVAR